MSFGLECSSHNPLAHDKSVTSFRAIFFSVHVLEMDNFFKLCEARTCRLVRKMSVAASK